jgi:ribosomal protein S15P/S13E
MYSRVHKLVEYIKGMGAGGEGYTHLWSTLKGWELEEKVHKLVEYIKGMGAGREGYTNLWSTLKGWELEEKGTQTCGILHSLCTLLF